MTSTSGASSRTGRPTSPWSSSAATSCPDWTPLSFPANIVGRPGMGSRHVVYDGDAPAGAGGLFVAGRNRLALGSGATLPGFRGRGAQSAILAARIEDARQQGCRTVTTENSASSLRDRPSNSYRNIVRSGFREEGVRPNYRAPSVRSSSAPGRLARCVVRGVSLALLVVAAVAASAAQTAAARAPLQIGSVVPELLDPTLQAVRRSR